MKDYYYILGVNENATKNEIKTAYRKLSKKFHPDVNDGDNFFESRFKEINEAYEILNDDEQRIAYDLSRKKGNYKYTKNEVPLPSIKEFYLSKTRVYVGEEIELNWNVDNCTHVTINLFGKVEPVGSKKIIFKKPKNKILVKITGTNASYGSISKELNIEILEKEIVLKEESFIEKVKSFLHKSKNIFIILTFLIIGYIIINLNPVTNIKLDRDLEEGIDTTIFTLNGVDPFLEIIINEDLVFLDSSFLINSKVPLWNYLSKLIPSTTNTKPIAKIIDIDNEEYLFVLYFTGGAHCCFEYRAFKYNSNLRGYYCLGQYSFDASECGEPDDIIYPIVVNTRSNYFHSSYASGQYLQCTENNYREELVIKNDSFIIQPIGNSYNLTTCIIDYLKYTKIPELISDDDNGERELILNVLADLYSLTNSIDKIFFIYNTYMPNVNDRSSLWFEIMNSIVSEQVLEDEKIKEQIEEYKICLDPQYISKYNKLDYSLPEGFVIPTICDIYPESGWEYVRINSGIKEPFHISGDFNGDGLNDHAYFLYRGNLYNYSLFCFFQTKNGYKIYNLNFPGDSNSHPASDYILHEAKKNEFACLYDNSGQTVIEKLKLINSSIVVSGFEFGDPIVFIYNEANDSFDSYWSCHE